MNRIHVLTCAAAALSAAALPAFADFTPGNLIVLSTPASGAASSTVTLNEFAYNGDGTFGAPTAHAIDSSAAGISLVGAVDHDGLLHQTTDGKSLIFGGYQTVSGTANVVASAASRTIGIVNSSWNLSLQNTTAYAGLAIRSVVSQNGLQFWTAGNGGVTGGAFSVNAGGSNQLNATDIRVNQLNGNQLWGTSSNLGGFTIGAGLPTSGAQTYTTQMTAAPSQDPANSYVKSDVVFLDLNNDGTNETAYSTDGKNLIGKWHFDSNVNTWTMTGAFVGDKAAAFNFNNVNQLAAYVYNGTVELLAVTTAGYLYQLPDTNGISDNFSSAFLANIGPTPIYTAASGTEFRGLVVAVPEPASLSLLALCAIRLVRRKRHH